MDQQAYSISDASIVLGIGKTKIYQLIGTGELKARKLGKRTLFLKDDLDAFLSNLEAVSPKGQEV